MLKMNSKTIHILLFVFIFFFSFFLRTFKLAETPSGFHADEASFYINSLALSQTGKDEDGNSFPLSLASFIDPKPALFSYFQIPFVTIFTNHIFAARFTSVILGVLSICALYLFITEISSKKVAIISSLIVSISPWHLVVSRGTHEVIASFLFLTLSLYFFVRLLKEGSKNTVFLALASFVTSFLSMYFYHSAKVVLPLVCILLVIYFRKKIKTYYINSGILFASLIIGVLLSLVVQESSSRISAVSIFSDQGPTQKLTEQIFSTRNELPVTTVRVFYNKIQTYGFAITGEYLKYFSPEFLFLSGEKPTRYIVPDHGLLYLLELPLLLIGLYSAIRNKRKELPILLGILLISPLPAALTTQETPSLLRSFPMIISFAYFIALGIELLITAKQKYLNRALLPGLGIIYIWSLFYFGIQYHIQAKYTQPWYRNAPYTKIAQAVSPILDQYSRVEVTNDLRPLYAYFVIENLIPFSELQSKPYARNSQNYTLGKFSFNRDVCNFESIQKDVLYIAEVGCRDKNEKLSSLEVVKTISYDDGLEVYELLQVAK